MSITVTTKDLVAALDIATRATSTRSTLPVLAGVLLDFQNVADEMAVAGTNLEIGLRTTCPVVRSLDAEPFQAVPPARMLLEYVKSVRDDTVLLTYEEKTRTLTLKAGRNQTHFACIRGEDFPTLPDRTTMVTSLQLATRTLRELIEASAYAAATEEGRPILTGVNVAVQDGKVHACATDGFRLGYAARNGQVGDLAHPLTIPAIALTNLKRLLGADDDPVTMCLTANRNSVGFEVNGTYLVSQLVDGQFPDYRQIFPKSYNVEAVVNRGALVGAIRQAYLFSKDDKDIIRLDLTPGVNGELGAILVEGESTTYGKTQAVVEAAITGTPLLIAVNAKYALHTLAVIKTEKVMLRFGTPATPIVFTPCFEDPAQTTPDLHIVMPMHISR
jgi:DNA polymerase-3 subunit beta